jgi:hypothetical protein
VSHLTRTVDHVRLVFSTHSVLQLRNRDETTALPQADALTLFVNNGWTDLQPDYRAIASRSLLRWLLFHLFQFLLEQHLLLILG